MSRGSRDRKTSCLCRLLRAQKDGWITNATGERRIDGLVFSRVLVSFFAECAIVDRLSPLSAVTPPAFIF